MRHNPFRSAFALIELIFAIVIMGIVLGSAPMLIATATSSTSVALQQEGINEAASRVNMILTYPWDQNDTNESCIPPVLHVTAGDSELDENGTTARRLGIPPDSNTRTFKCGDNELFASAVLGMEGSTKDDIDDFAGVTNLTLVSSGSGGVDYLEQTTVKMTTTVAYIDDNASYNTASLNYDYNIGSIPSGSTNIKSIQVTLVSTSGADELNKTITLRAFSCNIGGIAYERKSFQ